LALVPKLLLESDDVDLAGRMNRASGRASLATCRWRRSRGGLLLSRPCVLLSGRAAISAIGRAAEAFELLHQVLVLLGHLFGEFLDVLVRSVLLREFRELDFAVVVDDQPCREEVIARHDPLRGLSLTGRLRRCRGAGSLACARTGGFVLSERKAGHSQGKDAQSDRDAEFRSTRCV